MTALQRVYRKSDLPAFCGIKRSQISELIKSDKFPKPIRLFENGRAVVWLESELIEWQTRAIADRDNHAPVKVGVKKIEGAAS